MFWFCSVRWLSFVLFPRRLWPAVFLTVSFPETVPLKITRFCMAIPSPRSSMLQTVNTTTVKAARRPSPPFSRPRLPVTTPAASAAARKVPLLHAKLPQACTATLNPRFCMDLRASTTMPKIPQLFSSLLRKQSVRAIACAPFATANSCVLIALQFFVDVMGDEEHYGHAGFADYSFDTHRSS